jgi:hypothetical protein
MTKNGQEDKRKRRGLQSIKAKRKESSEKGAVGCQMRLGN